MSEAENKLQKGIEIAARLINETRDMCHGVHIMAIGLEKTVPEILKAAKL
jgi:methylenetetrahydrofolate reductase (NADPH)